MSSNVSLLYWRVSKTVISNQSSLSFVVGLKLEGAVWNSGAVEATSDIQTPLPKLALRWVNRSKSAAPEASDLGSLPVYLNSDRSDLLFTARLPVRKLSQDDILQRGIAVVCL